MCEDEIYFEEGHEVGHVFEVELDRETLEHLIAVQRRDGRPISALMQEACAHYLAALGERPSSDSPSRAVTAFGASVRRIFDVDGGREAALDAPDWVRTLRTVAA
jgi:hypothetical protein